MAATKATPAKTAVATKPADEPAEAAPTVAACVVDDGTVHNGLPVHGGKVCSAHENRYYQNGQKRP